MTHSNPQQTIDAVKHAQCTIMQVQTENKPYDSINVTPMLDLVYVLLVVFILMTTATVQGLTMNLPKPSNKPSAEKHDVKIIQITSNGSILVNGIGVTMSELKSTLLPDGAAHRYRTMRS